MKRSPSILQSILHAYIGPSQSMWPHTITDPPPHITTPSTSLLLSPSPDLFQAHFLPYDLRKLSLVSSDCVIHFQSSRVQSLCLIAKSIVTCYAFVTDWAFFSLPLPSYQFPWGLLHTFWTVTWFLVIFGVLWTLALLFQLAMGWSEWLHDRCELGRVWQDDHQRT